MVDTKTIETFLKEANGSLQPAHKTILEDFLTEAKVAERIQSKIKIELEDIASQRRQYKDSNGSEHEIKIQKYRIEDLKKGLVHYQDLERQSEEIIKEYRHPESVSTTGLWFTPA